MGLGTAAFYAAEAGFLFVIMSCSLAYSVTNATLGTMLPTVTDAGTPTVFGLITHAAMFAVVAYALLCWSGELTRVDNSTPGAG